MVDQVSDVLLSVMIQDLQFHLNEIVDVFCLQIDDVAPDINGSSIVNEVKANLIKRKLTTFNLSLPASFYFPMIKLEDSAVVIAGSVSEISNCVDDFIQKIVFDDVLVFACVIYRNFIIEQNCVLAVQIQKFRSEANEIINCIMERAFYSWEKRTVTLGRKLH